MKIQGNEIKPGMIIELNNDHWTVLKAQHVKPGKGGAFNQVELKSLTKGTKLNQRFRSSENVERSQLEEKEFNFLYSDDSGCFFMDPESFEQISLKKELLGEKLKLLSENLKVTISFLEENPLSVDLPTNIECEILGDINNDENLNSLDVILLLGIIVNSLEYESHANIDFDGRLNIFDLYHLIDQVY